MKKSNKLLRVHQLDAKILDDEILKVLQQKVAEVFDLCQPGLYVKYTPEINLLLRLICLKNIILYGENATFGQQMLNIQYQEMSQLNRFAYIVFDCFPYFKERILSSILNQSMHLKISKYLSLLSILKLVNFLWFLNTGLRPHIRDRLLFLNQEYCASEGVFSKPDSKFFIRELLWNCLNDFLISFLPLMNIHNIKYRLHNMFSPKMEQSIPIKPTNQKLHLKSDFKCSFCNQEPTLPHHMGCLHIFCYYCLKGNQELYSNFQCPKCNKIGKICLAV